MSYRYGGRQIAKGPDVETAKFVAKAGDPNFNAQMTGQALGTIGKHVGKAVDSLGGKKNKTNPGAAAPDISKLKDMGDPFPPVQATPLDGVNKLPELGTLQPRPRPSIPNPTATSVNENPYQFGPAAVNATPRGDWQGPLTEASSNDGPYVNVPQQDWGATNKAALERSKVSTAGSWYNPQHPGSGNIVTAQGRDMQSPINRTISAGASDEALGQAVGAAGTAIGRGFGESLESGRPPGDYEQEQTALSYLGRYDVAATEAANEQIRRRNYKRQVWDNKRKEADQEFGKLQIEPSGISSYDESVQRMTQEWKNEMVDVMRNKDQYDPAEYSAKLTEIANRSRQYNTAAQNIQATVADYMENIDNISPSTDPEVIDLLDTLSKGGHGLSVANVNGVPTYTGMTLSGANVSIPISEIASGNNAFRFNNIDNGQKQIDAIVTDVAKFTKDRQGLFGLERGHIGWDQIGPRVDSKVSEMLRNDHAVRSILADRFGYDFDDYNELVAGGRDPKALAKELLMEDIHKQMEPVLRSVQHVPGTTGQGVIAQEQKQRQLNLAQQRINKPTAAQRNASAQQQYLQNALSSDAGVADLNARLSKQNIKVYVKDGRVAVVKNPNDPNKREILGKDDNALAALEQLNIKVGSPINRSPFKRLMDFFSSPFKRNGSGKKYSKKELKKLGFSKGYINLITDKYGGDAGKFLIENPGQGSLPPVSVKSILGDEGYQVWDGAKDAAAYERLKEGSARREEERIAADQAAIAEGQAQYEASQQPQQERYRYDPNNLPSYLRPDEPVTYEGSSDDYSNTGGVANTNYSEDQPRRRRVNYSQPAQSSYNAPTQADINRAHGIGPQYRTKEFKTTDNQVYERQNQFGERTDAYGNVIGHNLGGGKVQRTDGTYKQNKGNNQYFDSKTGQTYTRKKVHAGGGKYQTWVYDDYGNVVKKYENK